MSPFAHIARDFCPLLVSPDAALDGAAAVDTHGGVAKGVVAAKRRLTMVAGFFALSVTVGGCSSNIEIPDLSVPETLPRVEATTALGTVRGVQEGPVLAFYGVPYAAPIAGLDRFLPPKPAAPFAGIFDATDYGQACAQVEATVPTWMVREKTERFQAYIGYAEIAAQPKGPNCLNANIWTATLTPAEPAPVMVFLHGGGLNQGSNRSAYVQGASLAKRGAVVVNINYRLGIQGFIAGESQFEGDVLVPNRGIMDMLEALRWVRDHIGSFGGDPSRVTVVGESGGAFAVWALLSSPASEGLLHRAIVESAPPIMTPAKDLEAVSKDVLKDIGVAPGDTKALAALADKDIPHTLLSEKLLSGDTYGWLSKTNLPFNGAYGTELIPDDTLAAFKAGRSANVDVIIGINKHEARGLSIMVPLIGDALATQITSSFLHGVINHDDAGKKRVKAAYENQLMPGASSLDIDEQIQQDGFFRQPNIRAAEIRSQSGGTGRTYMYEFNWESPCCDGEVGAIHAFELAFAYDNLHAARMLTLDDPTAQPLATAMGDAWVNFAKTGVPSSSGLPEWPVYEETTRPTMMFDRTSTVVNDVEKERRLWWNEEFARRQ